MASSGPTTNAQILNDSEEVIRRALPENWKVTFARKASAGRTQVGPLMTLNAPSGERVTFVIKATRSPSAQSLVYAVDQLSHLEEAAEKRGSPN